MNVELDKEGFLKNLEERSKEVAEEIAETESILLCDEHWEIITILRDFYKKHKLSPAMRPFVKLVKEQLGAEKGNSIYLMKIFAPNKDSEETMKQSPAKVAAKIAGLPKPDNCI